jgi:hypothetical protein
MPRRKRRAYPSDLTNSQWAGDEPMIPNAVPRGEARDRRGDRVSAARGLFMAASAA